MRWAQQFFNGALDISRSDIQALGDAAWHQDDSDLHLHRDRDHRGLWWCDTHHQQWQSISWHPVLYQCALHGHAHLIAWKRSLAKLRSTGIWRLATSWEPDAFFFWENEKWGFFQQNVSMASWKTIGLPWIAMEMFGMVGAHGYPLFILEPTRDASNDGAPNHSIFGGDTWGNGRGTPFLDKPVELVLVLPRRAARSANRMY